MDDSIGVFYLWLEKSFCLLNDRQNIRWLFPERNRSIKFTKLSSNWVCVCTAHTVRSHPIFNWKWIFCLIWPNYDVTERWKNDFISLSLNTLLGEVCCIQIIKANEFLFKNQLFHSCWAIHWINMCIFTIRPYCMLSLLQKCM